MNVGNKPIYWKNLSQEKLQNGITPEELQRLRFPESVSEKKILETIYNFLLRSKNSTTEGKFFSHSIRMLQNNPKLPKVIKQVILKTFSSYHSCNLPLEIPHYLKQNHKKNWFYAQDPFFRTGYKTFNAVLSDLKSFFRSYTYLIIKPDGLVSGSFPRVVKSLQEEEFEIVSYDTFQYHRNSCRLFWYYQSNLFPDSWFKLFEMVLAKKQSVIFLLRDTKVSEKKNEHACSRLLQLKGSTESNKRKPHHLRSRIGAGSGLFCYIHSPDDPLSMIREWGIILSEKQRVNLLKKGMGSENKINSQDFFCFKDTLLKQFPKHDIDYESTKERLKQYAENLERKTKEQFLRFINDDSLPWQQFLNFVSENELKIKEWDLITFCGNRSEEMQRIKPITQ